MNYDLIIIGAGWAGFNAALKAKALGIKVAVIDKSLLGGVCLNRGCIPTKALIQSAKTYSLVLKKSANFGVNCTPESLDFAKIQQRKDRVVEQLRQGMQYMLKGIDYINSSAEIISANQVKIDKGILDTKYILIATGSRPVEIAGLPFDGKKILSSDDILNLSALPKTLLIVGGGVIGCEFACMFSAFGSAVTIVEKMPQILPQEDKEVVKKLEGSLRKKSIKVLLSTDATSLNLNDFEKVLVCVGRTAVIDVAGVDKVGIKTDKNRIIVDQYQKTNVANIFAAGDCTGKVMLAHFAAYQGEIAAQNIAAGKNLYKADSQAVPNCIFTDPEIASVGQTEQEAIESNIEIKTYKFDFMGSGMARILDETDGFIKLVADKKSGVLLGASIIGPRATELIGILTLAVENKLTIAAIRKTIFAHPSLSEGILEAVKERGA